MALEFIGSGKSVAVGNTIFAVRLELIHYLTAQQTTRMQISRHEESGLSLRKK